MKIRHRFKELWMEHDMIPLKEITEATGIDSSTLSKLKKNPYYKLSFKNIDKLCNFFHVEPGDLIVSENGNNPLPPNNPSVEKLTSIKVNSLEAIVEYVRRLPVKEREAVEGIYRRVLETVVMAMEK